MWWMIAALAQVPTNPAAAAPEMLYVASTTEAAASKRFAGDSSNTGPVFDPAAAVRVLIRENGWIRVRSGDDYGWVPEAALVAENPKPATTLSFPQGIEIPGAGQ